MLSRILVDDLPPSIPGAPAMLTERTVEDFTYGDPDHPFTDNWAIDNPAVTWQVADGVLWGGPYDSPDTTAPGPQSTCTLRSYRAATVTAHAIVKSGHGDIGVVARYVDANNYYLAELNNLDGDVVRLWKRRDGLWTKLAEHRHTSPLPFPESYGLTLSCTGPIITVKVTDPTMDPNGAPALLLAQDTDLMVEGSVGVRLNWGWFGVDRFLVERPVRSVSATV